MTPDNSNLTIRSPGKPPSWRPETRRRAHWATKNPPFERVIVKVLMAGLRLFRFGQHLADHRNGPFKLFDGGVDGGALVLKHPHLRLAL